MTDVLTQRSTIGTDEFWLDVDQWQWSKYDTVTVVTPKRAQGHNEQSFCSKPCQRCESVMEARSKEHAQVAHLRRGSMAYRNRI